MQHRKYFACDDHKNVFTYEGDLIFCSIFMFFQKSFMNKLFAHPMQVISTLKKFVISSWDSNLYHFINELKINDPDPFAKIFMFKWIFTFFDTIINQLLEFKENMCQSVLRTASFSSLFWIKQSNLYRELAIKRAIKQSSELELLQSNPF